MDDLTLSESGLEPTRAGKVLLIACGALAHEILALKAANGWTCLSPATPVLLPSGKRER